MGEVDFSRLFQDGKEPGALRTIGEVAKALGIRQHVLRYWEEQFPNLRPLKRSGGRRYYRTEDIQLVATIDRLVHREGYTLRGARLAIANGAAAGASPPTPPSEAERDGQLAGLRTVLPGPDDLASKARLMHIRAILASALATV